MPIYDRKTAYGGLLRIRLSPSFAIKQYDHADLIIEGEVIPSDNDNLLDFYCTNGIYGPVSPSQDFELFVMGTCDATTTLSFELDIVSDSGTIGDYVYVNDRDKQLTPCIQTCFAYTSVDMIDGCWTTQRRLRVLTHRMNLSDDTEYVTLSLDNEALAVVSVKLCLRVLRKRMNDYCCGSRLYLLRFKESLPHFLFSIIAVQVRGSEILCN